MTDLSDLARAVQSFADEREWAEFHDSKNLSMALASEAGELAAVLRWARSEAADALVHTPEIRGRLEQEIADVAICLLLLCNRTGIELESAVQSKLAANAVKYPVSLSKGRADPPR